MLEGKRVLIAAHGNSLRALVKYFDHIKFINKRNSCRDVNIDNLCICVQLCQWLFLSFPQRAAYLYQCLYTSADWMADGHHRQEVPAAIHQMNGATPLLELAVKMAAVAAQGSVQKEMVEA